MAEAYGFRPIARSDFALLGRWLTQAHVQRWWADDASLAAIEADYGACVDGTEPAQVFIALRNGQPLGLAQRFRLAAYPQYRRQLQALTPVARGAFSIDYLVGEQSETQRGWGTAMLAAFTQKLWLDEATAHAILVPVHAANRASWRALERIGYMRVASGELEPDNPSDNRDHLIYRIKRPQAVSVASAPR